MNDILEAPIANPELDDAVDFHTPHRFLSVGDDEIAYWRTGTGPDLLLVHGWPLHAATWRDLLPILSEHFTCHLMDLPGTGHTRSPNARPLSLGKHQRTVLGVIEELGLDRLAMLAHDSGAAITRLVADELGDRCWALVMGNTEIPGHRPWLVIALGIFAKLGGAKGFANAMKSRRFRHSYFGFGTCFDNRDHIDGSFHDWFVEPLMNDRRAMIGQLRLLAGFDWADVDVLDRVHRELTAPVQLIWGAGDPFFPLAKARNMRFAGGQELEVFEDAKLFAHEEHPERFAQLASAFLQRHAPA